jgi:beta-lactamase class A
MRRRAFLAGLCAAACARPAQQSPAGARDPFAEIERALGGRVGVFALDTKSGTSLSHRADERFAMCSTFKWALVAAVLLRVDHGELALEQSVPFGEADLLEYAPVTREQVAHGSMSVAELSEAAVTLSDNTAANLLLSLIDGPAGLTQFFRARGDVVTRLDRNEPTLNTNLPGDPRDTTSPRAMVGSMNRVLLGNVLSAASRQRLIGWLKDCKTGRERLRAGLPANWTAGDKTGTGNNGAANDLLVAWPPERAPILVAAYLGDSRADPSELSAAHAKIGRLVARSL